MTIKPNDFKGINTTKLSMYIQMEQLYTHYLLKRDPKLVESIKKQEAWRQKQIDIYYRIGRPLYSKDNKFIE